MKSFGRTTDATAPAPWPLDSDLHPAFPCLAKFRARCHNCGEQIEVGDAQWYAPGVKLVSHNGEDPFDCGLPIDAPRRVKPAPFKRETSAWHDWALEKEKTDDRE